MAKLFDDIFRESGSGDFLLVVTEEAPEPQQETTVRLRCHSLILTQHPYFLKMLSSEAPLLEGRLREAHLREGSRDSFVELIRFIYTGQIDIHKATVAELLCLSDKYCIDEVIDLCLKYIRENFDADMFFTFYRYMALSSAYQERIRDHLLSRLRQRRYFCAISEDSRWSDLPLALVEEILSQDDLPLASEAEILSLIVKWWGTGQGRCRQDMARLLSTFRKAENIYVRTTDVYRLVQALGLDVFSSQKPRNGCYLWDPPFTLHDGEPALVSGSELRRDGTAAAQEIHYQMGPKDFLQQEPGWTNPGVHRCHVKLSCNSWSHRERRLLRGGSRNPLEAAALSQRGFESRSSRPAGHERSPSPPPPCSRSRGKALEPTFESFDIARPYDSSDTEQGVNGSASVIRSHVPARELQDKVLDHELVEHQIVCGVYSGQQRHGVRFSQRDRNAIYLIEDLNGKQFVSTGGTTSSVSFDLELLIGEPSKCNVCRCRFAVLRNRRALLEEWFDISAKVPLRFYISSSYFDKNSPFVASVKWLRPQEPQEHFLQTAPGNQGDLFDDC
eukprot:TRINITY_DN49338_c0_g1_i1.p1 TRINITY_DN49338_c0_g1~~TRINITY_DN49338_c0_g1_i1.p1  ORF type:complete len:559 (+),score=101.17 TRINITY_DN49338_c0_g1_i1:82-1758(+)